MFPVNISYFNEEIFHFDVIQYVKMITVFKQWNDAIYTVFSFTVV